MANIKQQMKRNLTNEKRRLQNASFKSSLKTALKAVDAAVAKGFLHKNNAARHKSALCKKVNSL